MERRQRGEVSTTKNKGAEAKPAKAAYASIPASQLGTQRLRRLPGDHIRVLLVAHAVWTPKKSAPMPISTIAKLLRMAKPNVSAAIRALQPDLLILRTPAVRPGKCLGPDAHGSAAVFEVAGRRPNTAHRVFEPGDPRYDGSFRIPCDDLRRLAAMLSASEAQVLFCIVLPCSRSKHGEPQRPRVVSLSGRSVTKQLPDLPARTADAAIRGLTAKGLLTEVSPAAGRRPASFEPAGLAASTIRRGRQRAGTASRDMHGVLQGGSETAHKPAKLPPKSGVSAVPGGVVRSHKPNTPRLCAPTNPFQGNPDLAAALRLVSAGPVIRDTGAPCPIAFEVGTSLLARRWITVVSLPAPGSGTHQRAYQITADGRAALAKHDKPERRVAA